MKASLVGRWARAAVACAAVGFGLSAHAVLTAKSYITDGLIWQLDGIENVAYGEPHDSSATSWKDLVGGKHVPIWTNASFVDTGVSSSGVGGTGRITGSYGSGTDPATVPATWRPIFEAFTAARYTYECAFNKTKHADTTPKSYTTTFRSVFLLLGNDVYKFGTVDQYGGKTDSAGFSPNGSSSAQWPSKRITVDTVVGQHTLSCSQDELNCKIRFDDEETPTTVASYGACNNQHGIMVNQDYNGKTGLDGFYHSIRFYNRPLTADEAAVNRAVDKVRYFGVDASTLTLPTGWRFVTTDGVRLLRQANFGVSPSGAGQVKVEDGEPTDSGTYWGEHNGTMIVHFSAVPAEGYAFAGWRADGLTDDQKLEPTLAAAVSDDITAIFRKTDGSEVRDFTWGGTATDSWDNPKLWHDADGLPGLPAAFDNVTIPAKKTAMLTNTTPKYGTLVVVGTLSLTNWETCVRASAVTVANGGKVTVAGLSTDQATNRVWIACDDCTIAAGGAIDVNDLGFRGSKATASGGKSAWVSGPTKGKSQYIAAAHGGHGGYGSNLGIGNSAFKNVLPTADDVSAPKLPGSGGYPQDWGAGTDGGGAVYISATRRVTVNGSILASVTKMTSRGSNGAGGAVLIECEMFCGTNGVIRADGGSVNASQGSMIGLTYGTGAGGGGMVAIKYDSAKETSDMVLGMTISAEAGLFRPSNGRVRYGDEECRYDAGLGTVWLTDGTLLPSLVGKGLTGALVNNPEPYAVEGDLTFASGHVRFPGPAAKVTVGGNLVLSGDNVRLEVGGLYATNRSYVANIYAGETPNCLTVGGSLTLAGGSRLDLRSAMTNATQAIGASLVVAGALTVETNSELHCWSDEVNGGSPHMEAQSFWVKEGGLVSGFGHGFSTGFGPGRPSAGDGYGGSHGGCGSAAGYSSVKTKAYDDEWLPMMPGGGGRGGAWAAGGMGGGVVYISVKKEAVVDGTIDVKGANGNGSHPGAGSAGGSILIQCQAFSGAETGKLLAHGGNGVANEYTGGGGGGGGRISVWTSCKNLTPKHKVRHLTRTEDALPAEYLGTNTVYGGTYTGTALVDKYLGEDGTVRWTDVNPLPGLTVFVR